VVAAAVATLIKEQPNSCVHQCWPTCNHACVDCLLLLGLLLLLLRDTCAICTQHLGLVLPEYALRGAEDVVIREVNYGIASCHVHPLNRDVIFVERHAWEVPLRCTVSARRQARKQHSGVKSFWLAWSAWLS
jgi:hypothetical protein